MLLSAENVSKTFRSLRALAVADLAIEEDDIIVLIARLETGDWHEIWYRIAAKFRRRPDAA